VGEVEAVASADLDNQSGQAGQQLAAQLGLAALLVAGGGVAVELAGEQPMTDRVGSGHAASGHDLARTSYICFELASLHGHDAVLE
jgi:hypothetical protein